MTSNLWKDIELYCGCDHNEQTKMSLIPSKKGYEYVCDKKDCGCKNAISLRSFERMIDYLFDKLLDAEINGNIINFTNYKWRDRLISFQVIEHKSTFKISVLNKESFK